MPRWWLANVIYSVVGQPFGDWVTNVIKHRDSMIKEDENKHIVFDPEVLAAFQEST